MKDLKLESFHLRDETTFGISWIPAESLEGDKTKFIGATSQTLSRTAFCSDNSSSTELSCL